MSLSLDQARNFHKDFYHAANAVLFVSGNVTEEQIAKLVNSRFSGLPDTTEHPQLWRRAVINGSSDETREYSEQQAKSERLAYASLSNWAGEGDVVQDEYTRQFTEQLLNSALPGSLAKPLRLDHFVVSGYELNILKLLDKQVELVVFAWPDEDISLEKVRQSLLDAIAKQGTNGVPTKSFERIRKRWLQTARRESVDSQTTLWRTWHMLTLGLLPNTETDHLQRIEAVSKADVDSLLAALGKPQRKISGYIKAE